MSSVQPLSFSEKFMSSVSLTGFTFTGRELGGGSDAVVVEADHLGLLCAAKKLHQTLFDASGGAQRLVDSFEHEITSWYALRHPHIVLLLGVHFEQGSHVPTLFLEKMQTSLRKYIELHKKAEVPLPDRVFILRQVSQALAYLHSHQPSLVHHDLSPNSILLNQDSLLTKITDVGMSRVVDVSYSAGKPSVKPGTLAFMPPEALVSPPQYTEKLDIFSFGNITLFTVTHLWPEPGPSIIYEEDKVVGLEELQRREQYTRTFNAEERCSFFPMIKSCLENRRERRPTSLQLVQQMRRMEEAHPRLAQAGESNTTAQHIHQLFENDDHFKDMGELQQMQDEMRRKDEQSKRESASLSQENQRLQQENQHLQQERDVLQQENQHLQQERGVLQQEKQHLQQERDVLQQENQHLQQERGVLQQENQHLQQERGVRQQQLPYVQSSIPFHQMPSAPVYQMLSPIPVQPVLTSQHHYEPPKNARVLKYQKTLNCESLCHSIAVKGDLICVGCIGNVFLFSKRSGTQIYKFRTGHVESCVWDVAFVNKDTIAVSADGKLRTYTTKGQLVRTFKHVTGFLPYGLAVAPDERIFVCDIGNRCICVFNCKGRFLLSFSTTGRDLVHFDRPHYLCIGKDGLLYVVDSHNSRICIYDVSKNTAVPFIREFRTPNEPSCVAVDCCNHFVISSETSHAVMTITSDGQLVQGFGGVGSDSGRFSSPHGVAVDDEDCVYVCDSENFRIEVFR